MNAKGNIRRGRESKTDIVELSVAETVSKNRIRSAKLSLVDKQILKKLLASQGDVSPRALEQELGFLAAPSKEDGDTSKIRIWSARTR